MPTSPPSRLTLPDALLTGPFTVAQGAAAGVDGHRLELLVAHAVVRRVLVGVYVCAAAPDTLAQRAQAASLVLKPFVVACDRTAAWLWGVDTFAYCELEILPPLEVWTLRGHNRVRRTGCAGGERDLAEDDVLVLDGVLATEPVRTALDLACRLGRRDGLAALDAFMRLHGLSHAQLRAKLVRYHRRRGVVQARQLVALADPLSESPGESWARMTIIEHGLPMPVLQHWVYDDGRPVFRLDLAYPEHKIAIEYDGREFHSTEERRLHDRVRRAWLEERGWTVIVLTKDDFDVESALAWIRDIRCALGTGI